MPELPSVTVYVEHLRRRTVGRSLQRVRIASPFVLRSHDPPINAADGKQVHAVDRLGKRIVFTLSDELFLVLHLMIAGRLRWHDGSAAIKIPRKVGLAGFQFDSGTLILTEAGSKRRASLHLVAGTAGLAEHDRGGLEILEADAAAFGEALLRENHTLKRALADPRLFSGVGNAFSDEILHRAGLSPLQLTQRMTEPQIDKLRHACVDVLGEWGGTVTRGERGSVPQEGHRVPPADGRPRQVRAALSGVRHSGAALSSTRTTRATTARAARPAASCSPTAPSPGCSNPTGRAASRNWKNSANRAPDRSRLRSAKEPASM